MPPYNRLVIIGVGLLGGSIALAARQFKVAKRIVGLGRDLSRMQPLVQSGMLDEALTQPEEALADADLVVVAVPVAQTGAQLETCYALAPASALITDVGSTKEKIARLGDKLSRKSKSKRGDFRFVGSHPMAGSEKSGAAHARADLFQERVTIVTPTTSTESSAIDEVKKFWAAIGSRVLVMTPKEHDFLVASASHTPHVVSGALASSTLEASLPVLGSGWRDTTRIAAGDVELWRQILLDNAPNVLKGLTKFEKVLSSYRRALETRDDKLLARLLAESKRRRDSVGN